MADLYFGGNITTRADAEARTLSRTKTTVEFDTAATYGGRLGYWFEGLPWLGLALDVSFFQPHPDLSVIPVSVLLMLRYPIWPSEVAPDGQLQPYLGIGPGVFISHVESGTGLNPALPSTFSETSVQPGLDLRAGLAWQFHKSFAIYGEYRFTYAKPQFEGDIPVPNATLDTTVSSHHFLVGISYRF
jgi:hypothetical protein